MIEYGRAALQTLVCTALPVTDRTAASSSSTGQSRTGEPGMNLKTFLKWAAVAVVIYFLVSAPTQAGGVVNGIFHALEHAAQAVITFIKNIDLSSKH